MERYAILHWTSLSGQVPVLLVAMETPRGSSGVAGSAVISAEGSILFRVNSFLHGGRRLLGVSLITFQTKGIQLEDDYPPFPPFAWQVSLAMT